MWTREAAGALLLAVPFVVGLSSASAPGAEPDVLFSFADPEIVESSGLVAGDGLVVTVNDSGDAARVFTVDAATGETVGVSRWDPASDDGQPEDVEALAPGPAAGAGAGAGRTVWVGDIGDNGASREKIRVARVPVGRGDRQGSEAMFDLVYPDGARDAETLMAHPETGRLFVVSKSVFGGTVYAAPTELDDSGPNRLEALGPVLGIATDGAFFPDGQHVIVRSYTRAVVYTFPQLVEVASMDLPEQQQGEGIAVDESGRVLLSSEGLKAPVLQLRLPEQVRTAVESRPAQEGAGDAADGSQSGGADLSAQPSSDIAGLSREVWGWLTGAGALAVLAVIVWGARRRGQRW